MDGDARAISKVCRSQLPKLPQVPIVRIHKQKLRAATTEGRKETPVHSAPALKAVRIVSDPKMSNEKQEKLEGQLARDPEGCISLARLH